MRQRQPRERDEKYLTYIRSLPCALCGAKAIAAHVRFACPIADKRETGKGEKPDDRWALPLCPGCHDRQHGTGERHFWFLEKHEDPIRLCLSLRVAYLRNDREQAERIVAVSKSYQQISATEDNQ
jgi:hypothetical protein